MQAHHITLTEKREVDHLCISLNKTEVEWLNTILCDWVDNEHATAALDGVNVPPTDTHTAFATTLINEACGFMWDTPDA